MENILRVNLEMQLDILMMQHLTNSIYQILSKDTLTDKDKLKLAELNFLFKRTSHEFNERLNKVLISGKAMKLTEGGELVIPQGANLRESYQTFQDLVKGVKEDGN